jgi:hypothetical protein
MSRVSLFWVLTVLGSVVHLLGFLFAQVPKASSQILIGLLSTALMILLCSLWIGKAAMRTTTVLLRPSAPWGLKSAMLIVIAQAAVCLIAIVSEL